MLLHAKFYLANEHFSPCSANWHFAFGRVSKIFSITKLLLLPRGILQTGQDFCLLSFVINLAWRVSQTKWSWKSRGFVLIINFVWAMSNFLYFLTLSQRNTGGSKIVLRQTGQQNMSSRSRERVLCPLLKVSCSAVWEEIFSRYSNFLISKYYISVVGFEVCSSWRFRY